jgi:hypothetical protein
LAALQLMHSLIPENIVDLTVDGLMAEVKEQGGLYSYELARELKSNKLLHCLVKHPDDIHRIPFLTGDFRAHFEDFDKLDVIEKR